MREEKAGCDTKSGSGDLLLRALKHGERLWVWRHLPPPPPTPNYQWGEWTSSIIHSPSCFIQGFSAFSGRSQSSQGNGLSSSLALQRLRWSSAPPALPPGCLREVAGAAQNNSSSSKSLKKEHWLPFIEFLKKSRLIVADGTITTATFWRQCFLCPTPVGGFDL